MLEVLIPGVVAVVSLIGLAVVVDAFDEID